MDRVQALSGDVGRRIGRGLDRLTNYAYFTARPRSINPIAWARRRYNREAESSIQAEARLWELLSEYLRRSQTTGCNYGDYWVLYRQVLQRRPHAILECGAGASTVVIAAALERLEKETGHRAEFVSLEEYPSYFEHVRALLPESIRRYVRLERRDRVESGYELGAETVLGCSYADVPKLAYDFVFVDGPTDRKDFKGPKCFNADLVNLVRSGQSPRVYGLIDQRIWTYRRLKRLLPEVRFTYHPVWQLTEFELS